MTATGRAVMARPGTPSFPEIAALVWPQMLMLLAQYCVTLADVLVTGRIASEAQAALGLVSVCAFLFMVVGMALSSGAVAVISQSLGAGLAGRARRYAGFILLLATGTGLAFSLTFGLARADMLALLRAPVGTLSVADCFLEAYARALPAYYLLLATNGIFQAYGQVMLPLYSMCLVALCNAILDLGLGLGMWGFPALGHRGVAMATTASVWLGALLNLHGMRRLGLLSAVPFILMPPTRPMHRMLWMRRAWRPLFRYAWPAGAAQMAGQGSMLVLCALLASLPLDAVGSLAGFAAGARIEAMLVMPAHALGLVVAILVGRTLGAGGRDQAVAMVWRLCWPGVCGLSLLAVVLWCVRVPVVSLVAPDAVATAGTLAYLTCTLPAAPFTVGAILLAGAMNGAGASLFNLVSFVLAGWLVRLPLAYLLSRPGWLGAEGVWLALGVSQACHCLCLVHVLRCRDWQGFALRPR